MPHDFIKPEVVVGAVIGALQREVTLPQLIWLDPVGDFVGAKNDTVTIKIPAVTSARTRALRSGSTRSRDTLHEASVSVRLDTDLYKDIAITDEEMTLDIRDFGVQVLAPIVTAMVEGWEEEIADLMTGATYAQSVDWDAEDPHGVLIDAGTKLDNARVPQSGRSVVLGSSLAADFLKSDQMRRADSAGAAASNALQDATLMRTAGLTVVKSAALPPDVGYAFHRTAFTATSKAPLVPQGAGWGTTMSSNGLTMRAIKDFDSSADGWEEILGFDVFIGSDVVQDHGEINEETGRFEAAESPDLDNDTDLVFVRAVEINGTGS